MLDSTRMRMCAMGTWGFHARTILKYVKKYDGEKYHVSTVYATLKSEGIKLRAYRDGDTREAKEMLDDLNRKIVGPKRRKRRTRLKQAA